MSEPRHRLGELDHVPISLIDLNIISPSPENDKIYRPIERDDPSIISLAESIRERGILEPIVVTRDGFILSGHRRYAASCVAGVKHIPCRQLEIERDDPEFLTLLREFNLQRVKSHDETTREEVISVNSHEAYVRLLEHRHRQSRVEVGPIELRCPTTRARISAAKGPFLEACRNIIADLEDFWPLSDRQIHYQLLNMPPLIHAGKSFSAYKNDKASYKALCKLLTRARHEGLIPHEVIADETRSVAIWNVFRHSSDFTRQQMNGLFKGYRRNLLQSQPNHIELVLEKLTVNGILEPVAGRYGMPVTVGRGYCSTRPKHDIAERYRNSGKEQLVLLIASDFDPDGDEIAHSLAKSLRDDFGIKKIHPVKVALTHQQVTDLRLPPSMITAKAGSSNYHRFTTRYGSDQVYELEAVEPRILQHLLINAIDSILDLDAFNAELDAEREDAGALEELRSRINLVLQAQAGIGTFG